MGRMEGCNPGEVGWAGTLSVDPKKGKVVLYLNRTLLTCRVFFSLTFIYLATPGLS